MDGLNGARGDKIVAKNIANIDGASAQKAELKILVDSNNAIADNADIAKDGDSDRDEVRADKVDRVCDVGTELSEKVIKKIESKDYLLQNLRRKSENVSCETLEKNEEKDGQRNVFFNSFVVIAFVCAFILYFLSRFLGKKSQKASQNPPFENADILSRESSSAQKAEENASLADAILVRKGEKN